MYDKPSGNKYEKSSYYLKRFGLIKMKSFNKWYRKIKKSKYEYDKLSTNDSNNDLAKLNTKTNIDQDKSNIFIIRSISPEDSSKSTNSSSNIISENMESEQIRKLKIKSKLARNKQIHYLKYREHVYQAATKLANEMPPFPDWIYSNQDIEELNIIKFNVGGVDFKIFESTLKLLEGSKLRTYLQNHSNSDIPFFDRDPVCFQAILHFYRTGHLHLPPNMCPIQFKDELDFWNIPKDQVDSCCRWNYYNAIIATKRLSRYEERMKSRITKNKMWEKDQTTYQNLQWLIYNGLTAGTGSIFARWSSFICGCMVLFSITTLLLCTSVFGRYPVSIPLNGSINNSTADFLSKTTPVPFLIKAEIVITSYFMAELIFRFIFCPFKIHFLSDTQNWIDFAAVVASLLNNLFLTKTSTGQFESLMILLKVTRIFRLFKMTIKLQNGYQAFLMTLWASAEELQLFFCILMAFVSLYGSIMFVSETLNNADEKYINQDSTTINSILKGFWWALQTLSTVGYGDIYPKSTAGYVIGIITIISGVIICQLPVPIVLNNFMTYFYQAQARTDDEVQLFLHCKDPEMNDLKLTDSKDYLDSLKRTGDKKFTAIKDLL